MSAPFKKRFDAPRLSREEAERQGRAARLAHEAFGQPGAVITFLNTHNEMLGARPIDVAVGSAAGMLAVEQAIALARAEGD